MRKMLKYKLSEIKKGRLSAVDNIKKFIDKIKKKNKELNIVLHLNEEAIEQANEVDKKIKNRKAGKLAGLGFLVKSNINVKGLIVNCASKTLENYRAGYNATVIDKLLSEDAVCLGMVNMDEFACGSSGETSSFGCCKNPRCLDRIPGGSSSGSAAGVAAGFCDFSLGSDTGGSIRNPASHCGVVGFKPSYGRVSRYGLIDLSMSLDQIGVLAENSEDCEIVFDVIKGRDERDSVSRYFESEKKNLNKMRVGVLDIKADEEIWRVVRERIREVCEKEKWKFRDIKIEHVDLGIQTYYPIVYTEFFSGTRKFDGRKYGKVIEESCGEEVLRRILGGREITKAEYSGRYYRRALAAKKLIEREFENAFKKYDLIAMPTVPKLPHKVGDKISIEDMYNYDALTVLANISEISAISIPVGEIEDNGEKVPIGIQLLVWKGNDNLLLNVSERFENEL
jgi:aspartyl-tRNA(Asn)/glutamyl-tRNA(Gln) amidotransferase subunit A